MQRPVADRANAPYSTRALVIEVVLYYLSGSAKIRLRDNVQATQAGPGNRSNARNIAVATSLLLVLSAVVSGCTTGKAAGPNEFNDPYEGTNRQVHAFNKAVDRTIYRPVSMAYGTVVPATVRQGVLNFSETVDVPRRMVNDLLQGDIEDVLHNGFRFGVNVTFGLLGLLDPATALGIEERDSDFGETLSVWGVGEGAYIAVPFFGPSTQRDLAGDVVDLATNPLSYVLNPPQSYYGPAARVGEYADYRYTFRNTLDEVLYNSADSYAQSRVIYLQSRRFQLGQSSAGAGGAGDDTGQ